MFPFSKSLNRPTLIEPGMRYFIKETLNNCHKIKETYYNGIFNICMLFFIVGIIFLVLLAKYKGKMNSYEREIKNREKQEYILSKIKNYQNAKRIESQELITNLPKFDNEYKIIHREMYNSYI